MKDGNKQFFTYGNAQKWVNMTVKYLCLIDALSDEFRYHKRLCELQSKFHIPVDSYIIDAVLNTDVKLPNKAGDREKRYAHPYDYVKSWSTWNEPSDYTPFQKGIKNLVIVNETPLDWENETWIKQAEEKSSIRSKYEAFFKNNSEN